MNAKQQQRDYYEVLGVPKSADAAAIKKAFRQKAKELHPDTNKSDTAEAQFKELGEAYAVLSDAQKRQVYDTYGHEGLQGSGGGYGGGASSWGFMDEFTDLSDIFSAFFNGGFSGGGGRGSANGPARGSDLRVSLKLSFMEAAFGCKKTVDVKRLDTCNTCEGSGAAPGTTPETCPQCHGHGQIRQTAQTMFGHFTQVVTCPQCHGTGQVLPHPCSDCHGEGRKEQVKPIELTIPAGVDSGTRLRVSNEGDAGWKSGPNGDLYVVINVAADAHFVRDGYDVASKIPVSFSQLALGDTITIPLLKGEQTVKIPAGSASGTILTLRGEGIPQINQPQRRGDFHLHLEVQVPQKLSAAERELLQQLRKLEQERLAKKQPTDTPKATGEEPAHPSGFFAKLKETLLGH